MWDKIPFYSLLLANLMKKNLSLHYCPDDGWFGDPIPFYWEGSYHVFFMKAPFAGGGSSWEHIASHDLVHWDEFPTAIRPGSIGSPDELACMTGSIIEKDGTFHMFYTGVSNAGQSICHATSRDLIHWDKDPNNPILLPDKDFYETVDWRDPEVIVSPESNGYWMLIAAKEKKNDEIHYYHACTALATSIDLRNWQVQAPIARSSILYMDCPTLHRIGETWCLMMAARYTTIWLGNSPRGPWRKMLRESPDSIFTTAGKMMFDGRRLILVNWLAHRRNREDSGDAEWGGVMTIPREFYLDQDGIPSVRCPEEILNFYSTNWLGQAGATVFTPDSHPWQITSDSLKVEVYDSGAIALLREAPTDYFFSGEITLSDPSVGAGILIRTSPGELSAVDQGYQILFEPDRCQVSLRPLGPYKEFVAGTICETTFNFQPNKSVRFRLFVDGSTMEIFLNDQYVLSSNLYTHSSGGGLALLARDGRVIFDHLSLKTRWEGNRLLENAQL